MLNRCKIRQQDYTDCGAACVASICAFYNAIVPLSKVRQYTKTDLKGTNIQGLKDGLHHLGFHVKAGKIPTASLFSIPLPAIAHVDRDGLKHFVVVFQASNKSITIMDPSDGTFKKMTIDDFSKFWTNIIVLAKPNDNFIQRSEKTNKIKQFWPLIKPQRGLILQAIATAMIITILGLFTSIYIQKVVDFVLPNSNMQLLNLLGLGMILLLLLQISLTYLQSLILLFTGQKIDANLILGYYKHIIRLPQQFFDASKTGDILSRINDAISIRLFVNDFAVSIILNLSIVIFSLGIMFLYYWKLALLTLSVFPIYTLMYIIANKANKKWERALLEQNAKFDSCVVEGVTQMAALKILNVEYISFNKVEDALGQLLKKIYISSRWNTVLSLVTDFATKLLTIAIIWLGSMFVLEEKMSTGELLSFFALLAYITNPAAALIASTKSVQNALIAADRLFEVFELAVEDENDYAPLTLLNGAVSFHDVDFSYGSRKKLFRNLNLTVESGDCIGIIGKSGSGKSTISKLICKIYQLEAGSIKISDINIEHIHPDDLRRHITLIEQNVKLFSGSILENIAIGEDPPHIDVDRVVNICKLTGVHQFIDSLPNGYNTYISENGNDLSGGERQLLAVARGIYRDSAIYIFDEITSSLDVASENKVIDVIKWLKSQHKTIIIISHRLRPIKICNHIYVLDSGQVIESGKHHELIYSSSNYRKIWNNETELFSI